MRLTFVWNIPIDAPPDRLWRYIADTNRINQYAGLPEFTFQYIPEQDGGSRRVGETRYAGWRLRWDEHPFEWIEGRYYELVRTYHNGPVRKFHTAVTLHDNRGGTLIEQRIECEPRWFFAIPAIYWEIGVWSRRRFQEAYASTALYEKIGEAPAYALVRRHFDLLRETIAKCEGAVVKTIGDSVMAAFFDPAKAIEAAFAMHESINKDNAARVEPVLALKIGIHHGPCIAVNMNDILDYFGTAVNLAARVQKESEGGDVVVTEEIWQDPHVQAVLAGRQHRYEKLNSTLRGLMGERTVYRICPDVKC